MPELDRNPIWAAKINRLGQRLGDTRGLVVEGKLTRMVGLTLEAVGCRAAIGGRCDVINAAGESIEAEVVGFSGESLYLMPTGDIHGLEPDARVVPTGRVSEASVGDELLGRVLQHEVDHVNGILLLERLPRRTRKQALRSLQDRLAQGAFHPALLHGVTGSGKTLVYMELAAAALEQGRSGIVLVPEIALAWQMVRRFRARFGEQVAVLHSQLSDGERFDTWRRLRRGVDGRRCQAACFCQVRLVPRVVASNQGRNRKQRRHHRSDAESHHHDPATPSALSPQLVLSGPRCG